MIFATIRHGSVFAKKNRASDCRRYPVNEFFIWPDEGKTVVIVQNSAKAISVQPDFLPTTARVLCESPHLRGGGQVFVLQQRSRDVLVSIGASGMTWLVAAVPRRVVQV